MVVYVHMHVYLSDCHLFFTHQYLVRWKHLHVYFSIVYVCVCV
jgi:hypothetical protein